MHDCCERVWKQFDSIIIYLSMNRRTNTRKKLTNSRALCEWIAGVARWASANRIVIRCMAHRLDAASVRTWIGAFTIDAGAIVWTFRTDNAFGATIRRCTDVVRLTRTHCVPIVVAAIAVWSAWRRLARILVLSWGCNRWNFLALEEWITSETGRARACRNVIFDMTNSQSTAYTDTWIDALETNTGQAIIAVDIRFAFATTSTIDIVRVAFIAGKTEACSGTVTFTAFSVRSTWRWTTWSCVRFTRNCCRKIFKMLILQRIGF